MGQLCVTDSHYDTQVLGVYRSLCVGLLVGQTVHPLVCKLVCSSFVTAIFSITNGPVSMKLHRNIHWKAKMYISYFGVISGQGTWGGGGGGALFIIFSDSFSKFCWYLVSLSVVFVLCMECCICNMYGICFSSVV